MTNICRWSWFYILLFVLLEKRSFGMSSRSLIRLLPPTNRINKIKDRFWKTLIEIAYQVPQNDLNKLLITTRRKHSDHNHKESSPHGGDNNNTVLNISEIRGNQIPVVMTRLYNALPLPFQCSVLVNETLNRFKDMQHRVGQLSERSSLTKKRKISELFRKYIHTIARLDAFEQKMMNGKLKELGWLIEKTEAILRYGENILPVARLCAKLIRKQNAYTDTIKIVVKNKTGIDMEIFKNKIRKLLPRVLEKYVRKREIKLPVANVNWVRLLRNNFFVVFDRKKGLKKNVLFCKIFFAASSQKNGARNAHLVLASIYDYGIDNIQKELQAAIKFSTHLKVYRTMRINFYDGELFPTYLTHYFTCLPTKEKCFLIDIMAIYSNVSRDVKTMELWKNNKLKNNDCGGIIYSTVRPIKTYKNMTKDYSKKRALEVNLSYKSTPTKVIKLTSVEIILISVLVLLLISSTVFFSVFCTYNYKVHQAKSLVLYKVSESSDTDFQQLDSNKDTGEKEANYSQTYMSKDRGSHKNITGKPRLSLEENDTDVKYYASNSPFLESNNCTVDSRIILKTSIQTQHQVEKFSDVDDKMEDNHHKQTTQDPKLGEMSLSNERYTKKYDESGVLPEVVAGDNELRETCL